MDLPIHWSQAVVAIAAALLGGAAGSLITKRLQRARPRGFISTCELSSTLFSRVDHIDMPNAIVTIRDSLHWPLLDPKAFPIPDGASSIPLGAATEMQHYAREFLGASNRTLDALTVCIDAAGTAPTATVRPSLISLMTNKLFVDLYGGMLRRREIQALSQAEPGTGSELWFEWNEDIASGPQVGLLCSYSVDWGAGRIAYVFKWEDEKRSLCIGTNVLAGGSPSLLSPVLSEVRAQLERDRNKISDLKNWLDEHVDSASKLVLDATIANMGESPMIVSRRSHLIVREAEREIAMFSESYEDGSETDKGTSSVVRALQRIGRDLDKPLPVATWVPREDIFVGPKSHVRVTFRSIQSVGDEAVEGLVHLYRASTERAKLRLWMLREDGSEEAFESPPFTFGTSVQRKSENGGRTPGNRITYGRRG